MSHALHRAVAIVAGSLLLLILLLALLPEAPPEVAQLPPARPSPTLAGPGPPPPSATPEPRTPIPELQGAGKLLLECAPALCLVNADGTGMQRIEPPPGMLYAMPAWAPDGASFVTTIIADPAASIGDAAPLPGSSDQLLLFSAEGRQLATFAAGEQYLLDWSNPVWSPDGGRVALLLVLGDEGRSVTGEPNEIWVLSGETLAQQIQPVAGGIPDQPPLWSGDGHWLAFLRLPSVTGSVGETSEVRLLDIQSGHTRYVAPGQGMSWQPGTQTLAYIEQGSHQVSTIDVVSGARSVLVSEEKIRDYLDPDEREEPGLWAIKGLDWGASWQGELELRPGGLAFAVDIPGPEAVERIFTVAQSGGLYRWPEATPGSWASHTWSPDGRFLAYPYWLNLGLYPEIEQRKRFEGYCPTGLMLVDMLFLSAAAEPCLMLPSPRSAWSPDGRWLVALARTPQSGVAILAPDNPRAHWTLAGAWPSGVHWQP